MALRRVLRTLRGSPGFSAVAITTLAIGIGANAAVFRTVNEVFLRPPRGIPDPGGLVVLARMSRSGSMQGFSHPDFVAYRGQLDLFEDLAAFRSATLLWRAGDRTRPLSAQLVIGGYFETLGVPVMPGRDFRPEEDVTPAAFPVAIVSHAMWRTRLDGDPDVVGRRLRLNDADFTIIGVAAEGFGGLELGSRVDLWIPLMMEAEARVRFPTLNDDFFSPLTAVGRLRPGVTPAQAQAEVEAVAAHLERPGGERGERLHGFVTSHVTLPDPGWRSYGVQLLAPLQGAMALVLLLVCVNLAGLLLARFTARQGEIAIQMALGARRPRIVRSLLVENVLITVPGALAGILVSEWIVGLIRSRTAETLELPLDVRVLALVFLLAVLAALAFGLPPALHITGERVADTLRGRPGGPRGASRLRSVLISGQIALSLALLVGAGLMIRSMVRADHAEVGFETRQLWMADLDLSLAGYTAARKQAFRNLATERLMGLPDVEAVSWATSSPVDDGFVGTREIVPDPAAGDDERIEVEYNEIGPDYVRTLGSGLVRGRDVTTADGPAAPRVAVLNETLARRLWPDTDPIGQRFRFVEFMGMSEPVEVAGIARDVRTRSRETTPRPAVLVPLGQGRERDARLLVRVRPNAPGAARGIRDEILRLDPGLPPPRLRTLQSWISDAWSDERLYAEILTLFGAFALLIACLGVYGAQSFDISRRTGEIAIRMAMGATRHRVATEAIRRGLFAGLPGVGAGLALSAILTRVLRSRLFGTGSMDPASWIGASLLMLACIVMASWLPTRRATRTDPSAALRGT